MACLTTKAKLLSTRPRRWTLDLCSVAVGCTENDRFVKPWKPPQSCQVRKCVRCTEGIQFSRLPCFHFQPATIRSLTNGIKHIVHLQHCAVWDSTIIHHDKWYCTMILYSSIEVQCILCICHWQWCRLMSIAAGSSKKSQSGWEHVLTTSCSRSEGCDLQLEIWNDNEVYPPGTRQDKTRHLPFALALSSSVSKLRISGESRIC